jgi:hypothetical protein
VLRRRNPPYFERWGLISAPSQALPVAAIDDATRAATASQQLSKNHSVISVMTVACFTYHAQLSMS